MWSLIDSLSEQITDVCTDSENLRIFVLCELGCKNGGDQALTGTKSNYLFENRIDFAKTRENIHNNTKSTTGKVENTKISQFPPPEKL